MKTIYVLTGPAGVGKSTVAGILTNKLEKSSYISGDIISHMPISGREKPWESEEANNLVWKNIKDLTNNFLEADFNVVIDWIIFWGNIEKHFYDFLNNEIEVRYIVLWTDEDENIKRDKQRHIDAQMGERVNILRDEFVNSNTHSRFFLDTTKLDVLHVVENIINDDKYIVLSEDLKKK